MFHTKCISLLWFFAFCLFTCILLFAKVEVDDVRKYKSKENFRINKYFSNSENSTYFSSKTIVAYSLRKFIESQGKEVDCPISLQFSEKIVENRMWTRVEDTNVYIYSAYYDLRLKPYYYIRVLAMIKESPKTSLYCHLDDNNQIYSIESTKQEMWYKTWDPGDKTTLTPYLISCKIPQQKNLPKYISISSKPCQKNNYRIRIVNNLQTQKTNSTTVCVKQLNFTEDITIKLLSWLEINRLLGASSFNVYISSVHVKTRKLLKWYNKNGIIKTFEHRTVMESGNNVWQRRKYEVITYNDCLYRNIHTSKFILPLDIDEIIIPKHLDTWQQLFTLINEKLDNYASFSVQNTYYNKNFINNNESIPFLNYLIRSDFSPKEKSGKSFISTSNTLVAFNHYTLIPLKSNVGSVYFIPKELVQMNHYKKSCYKDLLPECEEYMYGTSKVFDPIVLKYRNKLKRNVNNILYEIKR